MWSKNLDKRPHCRGRIIHGKISPISLKHCSAGRSLVSLSLLLILLLRKAAQHWLPMFFPISWTTPKNAHFRGSSSSTPSNSAYLLPTPVSGTLNPTIPYQSTLQSASRWAEPFSQGSRTHRLTHRQTHKPRYSVRNNRPHLMRWVHAMRSNNNK